MKLHLLRHTITALLLLPLLAGCRDTDSPESVTPAVYDIVCLRHIDQSGSTFTLTKPQSDRVITYTAPQLIDTTLVKVGDRLMLAYSTIPPAEPYQSGHVTALGYSTVYNDPLRAATIDSFPDWKRDPVYLLSAWMSEDFLNLRARLTFDDRPRRLFVMVDTLTLDLPYPACYLIHQLSEPIDNFERAYYLSIDMSALRRLPDCRGFRLFLRDSNLMLDSLTFDLKNLKY
ncbi:MAG: hypothetical protein K2J07_03930 [Muribaculaceae bacterium]|nr:hypothetical protein [Muribaculaceae bacterium]